MANVDSFELANRRAKELQASVPSVIAARYDRSSGRIVIHLGANLDVSFSPRDVQGLEQAKPSELEEIKISPSGLGLHFPKLDADLYVPALLEDLLGSRKWIAGRLGQVGGKSRSAAKRTAAKANGQLGGRPKRALREH